MWGLCEGSCLQRSEKQKRVSDALRAGATDACELYIWVLGTELGPPQEQSWLLTAELCL